MFDHIIRIIEFVGLKHDIVF